jgi:hypothetical protein
MSFGLQITNEYGQIIDTSKFTCTVHEIFTVSGGSSGTKSYTNLAGFTIYAGIEKYSPDPALQSGVSISYSGGYPTLNWFPIGNGASAGTNTIVVVIK